MKKPLYQIFKIVNDKPSHAERVATLRSFDSPALRVILKNTFDPSIEFDLPPGPVPDEFIPVRKDDDDDPMAFYFENKRLYIFIKGPRMPELTQWRREQLFIEFLSFHVKEERPVIIGMKDKKLPYDNINLALVKEAFPELL